MNKDESWIEEFLEELSGNILTVKNIENALAIKAKNFPEKIFKYRKFDNNSIENLKNDTLWFSSSDQYNDPYDSAITFSAERIQKAQILKSFDEYVLKLNLQDTLTVDEILSAKNSDDPVSALGSYLFRRETDQEKKQGQMLAVAKEITEKVFAQMRLKFNEVSRRGMKICSVSSTNNSVVMWSHYSQNHEGFCIEYQTKDVLRNTLLSPLLYPVIYSKELFDGKRFITSF